MSVSLYRRHLNTCQHKSEGQSWTRCSCPIQAKGRLANGIRVTRQSLNATSMTAAQAIVRGWEERGSVDDARIETKPKGTPVAEAIARFLKRWEQNKQAASGTLDNYRVTLLKPTTKRRPNAKRMLSLEAFCEQHGIRYVEQVELTDLEELQRDWHTNGFEQSTINQKSVNLKTFWTFLGRRNMGLLDLSELPIKKMAGDVHTKPFEQEQMLAVLTEATNPMDRAMILLMRYSGLRILDAITCSTGNIHDGNKLLVRQQKVKDLNSALVSVELPNIVVDALQQFKPKSHDHWFWDGRQSIKNIRQWWYKRLKKLFGRAGVPDGHPHMLRHTFAVENITAGMSIKNVSLALGHSSVTTTERHYLYWVKRRQVQLQDELKRVHASDPVLQALAELPDKVSTISTHRPGSKKLHG